MPPAVTCPVKCRPHRRIISPHPALAARDPLAATAELRSTKWYRSPPSLSLSPRAARPPCRSALHATARRPARAAVAVGGDGDGGGSSAALLVGAQSRHAVFSDELVLRAFSVTDASHRGQVRASGGPYLQHCVDTAALLAELGADSSVVAAGLLHDTVDDASLEYGFVSEQFGAGVADLVKGVLNLSHLSKLARKNNTASRTDEVDRLRMVFLATVDVGAVVTKLADRLHNMRTLDSLPKIKQQRFAKETLEIFAPLANQLGILNWKEHPENLCFKYLYPDEYEELSTNLLQFYNRDMIAAATRRLEQALEVRGLSFYSVYGRHKGLYIIYKKMRRKKLAMDEIYDIHGMRVILENKSDCFATLEIVHHLWPQIPGRFKDYIQSPKTNGYQSLHTVVLTEEMLPLEIQIRNRDMHLQAEFGIAAHWRYKEGLQHCFCSVPEMVEWVTWIVTWQRKTLHIDTSGSDIQTIPSHSDVYLFSYSNRRNHKGRVLVILLEDEKMSVQEIPQNSTILDLLKKSCCNDAQVRLRLNYNVTHNWDQELKMGDVLELIPSCKSGGYMRDFHQMLNHHLTISQS